MSEFALIARHFAHATAKHPQTILGIQDDCAISQIPADCQLVSCMDTLVCGRHFLPNASAYAIGFKAVSVNLSDLASMGAVPYAILLGLSLPKNDDAWLAAFAQGLADCCAPFGVELIGGDTTRSEVLTISVTALGFVPKNSAVRRSGAQIGDVVCVSGNIGTASFALQQLLQNKPCVVQDALDLPIPQVHLGQKLRPIAHSMIDISDGLGQDLGHILTASGVGAHIHLQDIPYHSALSHLSNAQKWHHQLNGGDDYQLCLTVSQSDFEAFCAQNPGALYAIGTITATPQLQLFYHKQPVDFNIQGWQHF